MATPATRTLNVRLPVEQYEELEDMVKARHYTSKGEYIRELLRESLDDYADFLREKKEGNRKRRASRGKKRKKR